MSIASLPRRFAVSKIGIAASAGLIGIALATGATLVTAANDPTEQMYACVQKTNGAMRLVGKDDTCGSSERKVSWSIQGPQGLPGADGENGQNGLPGSQGPEGDPGAGLRWRGEFAENVQYLANDLVAQGGSVYIALAPYMCDDGLCVTLDGLEQFALFAAAGKQGMQGEDGVQGPPGSVAGLPTASWARRGDAGELPDVGDGFLARVSGEQVGSGLFDDPFGVYPTEEEVMAAYQQAMDVVTLPSLAPGFYSVTASVDVIDSRTFVQGVDNSAVVYCSVGAQDGFDFAWTGLDSPPTLAPIHFGLTHGQVVYSAVKQVTNGTLALRCFTNQDNVFATNARITAVPVASP